MYIIPMYMYESLYTNVYTVYAGSIDRYKASTNNTFVW